MGNYMEILDKKLEDQNPKEQLAVGNWSGGLGYCKIDYKGKKASAGNILKILLGDTFARQEYEARIHRLFNPFFARTVTEGRKARGEIAVAKCMGCGLADYLGGNDLEIKEVRVENLSSSNWKRPWGDPEALKNIDEASKKDDGNF